MNTLIYMTDAVPKNEVDLVVYIYELVPEHRDKYPGEILLMGNTYVMLHVNRWLEQQNVYLHIHSNEVIRLYRGELAYDAWYYTSYYNKNRISAAHGLKRTNFTPDRPRGPSISYSIRE